MEDDSFSKFPGFPFKPYSIQIDFMSSLYNSLNKGGISMLESPTGTGKTLSIICSSLQWLVDRKKSPGLEATSDSRIRNQACADKSGSDDEPDWLKSFVVNKENEVPEKKVEKKNKFKLKKQTKSRNYVSIEDVLNQDGEDEDGLKKVKKNLKAKIDVEKFDDDEFLVEEYESEEDDDGKIKRKAGGLSISSSSDEEDVFDDEDEDTALKVYFCSRTHSQLSQFVKELRKTVFARELKVVCLGSRKNMCINEDVLKLGNSTRINEKCLELQKNKKSNVSKMKNLAQGRVRTKSSCKCPMLKKHKLQKHFKIEISQQEPLDIEDLVHLGEKLGTCPYYGSRSMVRSADLVVLPYQSLLSKSSRESLGLDLNGNIVIIDEAHNLADSLISMHDTKITISQLEQVHSHLEIYLQRFMNLLGPGNRRYIQTLMVLTRAFLKTLLSDNLEEVSGGKSLLGSMAINEFLFSLNIDNINLVKLLQYIKESNIIHKVSGYGEKSNKLQKDSVLDGAGDNDEAGSSLSGFRLLAKLLLSLTNNDGDGRIIISRAKKTCNSQSEGFLKFVMLTGEKIFSEIANQTHAVILAGGTLQPTEETRERLFPWLPSDELQFFSCDHIIPSDNILPISVSQGPSSQSFDFSFNSRSSPAMVQELGLLLCNLSIAVPEGIVVFFSSFDYESHVYDAWKSSGILERILKKKRVFREPRKTTQVEDILKEYKETIDTVSKKDPPNHNGAILLAVVGGKISEGINFSDGMGRCIVMVGLPYPSPSDTELMERVKHIEGLGDSNSSRNPNILFDKESINGNAQAGFDILRSCKRRGKDYYENLCMKAVNQSIGRAIRHINDYAAILLVDARYACDSSKRTNYHPTNKLPRWIKGRLISSNENYGQVQRLLIQFFKLHRSRQISQLLAKISTFNCKKVTSPCGYSTAPYLIFNEFGPFSTIQRVTVDIQGLSRKSTKEIMLLHKDIHKSKRFVRRKLHSLMSYLFRKYQKLPKTSPKNPFSEDNRRKEVNDLYKDLSEQWEPDIDKSAAANTVKANESVEKEKVKRGIYRGQKVNASRRRGRELAEKMKELEMMMMTMNANDVDHVMDIEEALYLYSRLTCPVYLELLDKFFMDMYTEFFLPKPSISIHSSMRKLGPVKI